MSTPTTGPTTGPGPGSTLLVTGTPVIPNWIVGNTPIAPVSRDTLAQVPDTFERQVMVAAQNEACRVTYGTDRLGAQLARVFGYGTSVLAVCYWGRGEVQSVGSLTVANTTPPGTVLSTHYTGTTGQTVNSKLVTACAALVPAVTHTDAFTGLAYSVIEFQVGADIGDIHAVVQGVKVYDPRDGTQTLGTPSTYKWSDNPALALADLITNTTYGWGQSIDWTSVTAAANACDAIVSGEKKRTIGITLHDRKTAEEWVEVLRAHAGCYVIRSGATYKLIPDATASSVKTFNKNDDLVKDSVQWGTRPAEERPNVVEVVYTDTSTVPWQTRSAIYPTNGLPPSGQELRFSRGRQLSGCQRYSQAIRECKELINHGNLEALTQQWDSFLSATAYEPGDVVTVNDGGLSGGILFRILKREWVKKGVWRFWGQKYDPAAYDSTALATPSTGNTTLPSPSSPPTVGTVTLAEEYVVQPTGAMPLSRIRATWTAITTWPFLNGYRVIVKDSTNTVVDDQNITGAVYVSPPIPALTTYTVSVYARSSVAQSAAASTATISLVGTGVESLATVASAAISTSGSWFIDGPERYSLYPGDTNMRIRMDFSADMGSVYTGSDMTTPGKATMLLDTIRREIGTSSYSWGVFSPEYDLGAERSGVIAMLNVQDWATLYASGLQMTISARNAANTITSSTIGYRAQVTSARYVRFSIATKSDKATSTTRYYYPWAIEFVNSSLAMLMPTVTDRLQGTTSAGGVVNIALPRRYISITDVQVTAVGSTEINPVPGTPVTSETDLASNYLPLRAFNAGALVAATCNIQITGVAA